MRSSGTQKKEHGLTPPLGWCKKAAARYSLDTGNLRGDGLAGNILYLFQSGVGDILKGHVPGDSFTQIEELAAEGKIYPLRNTVRALDEGGKSISLPVEIAYDLGFTEGCHYANEARRAKDFRSDARKIGMGFAACLMVMGIWHYCFSDNKDQVMKPKAENVKTAPVVAPR